jgi:hypothetical protein
MKTIKLTIQLIPIAILLTTIAIVIYNINTYGIHMSF